MKQGCFIFGNGPLKNAEEQLYNQLYPKLMSINCLNFDYVECQFQTQSPDELSAAAAANKLKSPPSGVN
jgi:hypothetical protein